MSILVELPLELYDPRAFDDFHPAGDFDRGNSLDRSRGEFRRDGLRCFLQLPRELKCGRDSNFTERGLFGLLGLHRHADAVERLDAGRKRIRNALFQ